MASTITEKLDSRNVSDAKTAEFRYDVRDQADEQTAIADIKTFAPTIYADMPRQQVDIEPVGPGHWLATVTFAPNQVSAEEPPLVDIGDSVFTFSTGGGTQRITQGANINNYAPSGETAPDFKGAINVGPNGVEGIDTIVPDFQFSETHIADATAIDTAYKLAVAGATGKFNNATWKGFAAKTVQFLGASGTRRGAADADSWEITYSFRFAPNLSGVAAGDITGIAKNGNEVLWFRHEEVDDQDAGRTVRRVASAHVDQYAETTAFSALGIGS